MQGYASCPLPPQRPSSPRRRCWSPSDTSPSSQFNCWTQEGHWARCLFLCCPRRCHLLGPNGPGPPLHVPQNFQVCPWLPALGPGFCRLTLPLSAHLRGSESVPAQVTFPDVTSRLPNAPQGSATKHNTNTIFHFAFILICHRPW